MNKLFLLIATAIIVTFTGCTKDDVVSKYSQYEFATDKINVDVTPETKTFRIELNFHNHIDRADVFVDEIETTAKEGVHFSDEKKENMLDGFTLASDNKSAYRDIVIYPENITEEVVIVYNKLSYEDEPAGFITKLTVTLTPKSK